jgi:hypothetical protein
MKDLHQRLDAIKQLPFVELWLESNTGQSLAVLANGDHAWLMFLRHNGDAGLSSRNADYQGPENAAMKFRLSNGQIDEYPVQWTVSRGEAWQAVEDLFVTNSLPTSITWHDDALSE